MNFEQEVLARLHLPERDDVFLEDLYAALCNRGWTDGTHGFTCTWRAAGSFVASYRDANSPDDPTARYLLGDYMEYYCGGNEGWVSDEVRAVIRELGWWPCESAQAHALQYPKHALYYLGQLQFERWSEAEGLIWRSHRSDNTGAQYGRETAAGELRVYRVDLTTGATWLGDKQVLESPASADWLPPTEWWPKAE
jgi:hypothetical protein